MTEEIKNYDTNESKFLIQTATLAKTITECQVRIKDLENTVETQNYIINELERTFRECKGDKDDSEAKLEQVDKDRIKLKSELQDLRTYEYELYNKMVDKDIIIDKANKEIDELNKKLFKTEKMYDKAMRRLDTNEKNFQNEKKSLTQTIDTLTRAIAEFQENHQELKKQLEDKQTLYNEVSVELNDLKIKTDTTIVEIEELKHELIIKEEIVKKQKHEVDSLSSNLKTTKASNQHFEREITQLKEFSQTMQIVHEEKLVKYTDQIKYLKGNKDKEEDVIFMIYEDLRSQCYEYKVRLNAAQETIRHQSDEIFQLTKDKNEGLEKIAELKKKLESTRISLENVKSHNLQLEIDNKDKDVLIEYFKHHFELKAMGLEEYYQKYVKLFGEHHLLKNKHIVLSNRFSQYELIVKTSKSMLEALRNRKNAKTQTDLLRNHDIAIMTDMVMRDFNNSGIMPSLSSHRSELSLHPSYKKKLNEKNKGIKPSKSYVRDEDDDSNKLIKMGESVSDIFPKGSNKTIALLKESKVKFSFIESQISTIKKAISRSRYDSKKSSESDEMLGVDIFETLNQIEEANKKKSEYKHTSSHKTKNKLNPRSNKRSRSENNTQSRYEDLSVSMDANNMKRLLNKTSPSLDKENISQPQPLMRRKFNKRGITTKFKNKKKLTVKALHQNTIMPSINEYDKSPMFSPKSFKTKPKNKIESSQILLNDSRAKRNEFSSKIDTNNKPEDQNAEEQKVLGMLSVYCLMSLK